MENFEKIELLIKEMEEKFQNQISALETKVEFLEFEVNEMKKQIETEAKG